MWLFLTLIHAITMAMVNYIDEYLTFNSSVGVGENIHKRIGGVLLLTMLFGVFSLIILSFFIRDYGMSEKGLYLSLFSGVPMSILFVSYFYLFQKFPANQILPLFGLTSCWLLLMEVTLGATLGVIPFLGVLLLVLGAYLLDNESLSWKIPTRLFLYMLPIAFLQALNHFLVKIVSLTDSVVTMFFYQYVVVVGLGIIMLVTIKQYRLGLLDRIHNQGKSFLGISFAAEAIAQASFLASALAVSLAALATYVSATSSIQYVFLFILLFLFPVSERSHIKTSHVLSMVMIVIGIFLIEFFK